MLKHKPVKGDVFSRLTFIDEYRANNKKRERMANCICLCGSKVAITVSQLCSLGTKSCGCAKKKHGMLGTGIYSSWQSMKTRCENKKHEAYSRYGGRGIMICKKWLKFEGFYEDMGSSWEEGKTIERINNNLGYRKDNCMWATRKEQSNNRGCSNKYYGRTISERSDFLRIPRSTTKKNIKEGKICLVIDGETVKYEM